MTQPFALPANLTPELAQVRTYWEGLRRGENAVPFADDVSLSKLPGQQGRLMLVDVLDKPTRFRFSIVGADLRTWYGADLADKFADEVEAKGPLALFLSQASATADTRTPTFYQGDYARLLLPLWGNGYVSAILGGVVR